MGTWGIVLNVDPNHIYRMENLDESRIYTSIWHCMALHSICASFMNQPPNCVEEIPETCLAGFWVIPTMFSTALGEHHGIRWCFRTSRGWSGSSLAEAIGTQWTLTGTEKICFVLPWCDSFWLRWAAISREKSMEKWTTSRHLIFETGKASVIWAWSGQPCLIVTW